VVVPVTYPSRLLRCVDPISRSMLTTAQFRVSGSPFQ
jgi:hypothetical protein